MIESESISKTLLSCRDRSRSLLASLDARYLSTVSAAVTRSLPTGASRLRKLEAALTGGAPKKATSVQHNEFLKMMGERFQPVFKDLREATEATEKASRVLDFIDGSGAGLPQDIPSDVARAARILHQHRLKGLGVQHITEAHRKVLAGLTAEIKETYSVCCRAGAAVRVGAFRQLSKTYENAAAMLPESRRKDAFLTLAVGAAARYRTESDAWVNNHLPPTRSSESKKIAAALKAMKLNVADLAKDYA